MNRKLRVMSLWHSRTYLDWAAAAPVSLSAKRAFVRALAVYGNPSSPHDEGVQAKRLLEDARTRIARLLEVKADAVIFTSNATEANNLAIVGSVLARIAAGARPEDLHVLYLPSMHSSAIGSIETLAQRGVRVEPLRITEGAIDLTHLQRLITPETMLVCVDAVCGETGARYTTRDVRRVLDAARKAGGTRIVLHVDAAQLPLVGATEPTRLGADTLALDAQKIGGVRGCGVLVAPRSVPLAPLMYGGGQERGLRPGTESPALATALAVALQEAHQHQSVFCTRARRTREALLKELSILPNVVVNEGKEQAPHILNLSLLGRDTDYLVALLSEAGFAVATKSACESESEQGSRAVLAQTGDDARARATLRISWGPTTSAAALKRFAHACRRAVRFMDENAILGA